MWKFTVDTLILIDQIRGELEMGIVVMWTMLYYVKPSEHTCCGKLDEPVRCCVWSILHCVKQTHKAILSSQITIQQKKKNIIEI